MMGIRSEVCFYFPKRSRLSHDETHKKFVPHILRKSITLIYLSEMSEADMPLWDKLLFYYFLSSNYFYSGRKGKQFVQLLRFMIFFFLRLFLRVVSFLMNYFCERATQVLIYYFTSRCAILFHHVSPRVRYFLLFSLFALLFLMILNAIQFAAEHTKENFISWVRQSRNRFSRDLNTNWT